MSASSAGTTTSGLHMSWEQYWDLPHELRAEYVDGLVYVNPPATFNHQQICLRIRDAAVTAFGDRCVDAFAVGWQLPTKRRILRIPDLMLLTAAPDGDVVTGSVPVAVEVVSTNRPSDLVLKATEYLEAGVGQYWIIDPRDREMDVFASSAEGWVEIARLADETPFVAFEVPPFGPIQLSLNDLLG